MTSIRKRLMISILAVLLLATLAVGVATYFGIRHEMDELYDANMSQLAVVASDMVAGEEVSQATSKNSMEWPRGEEIFLIQIWKNDKLSYSSHPIADLPLQDKAGFGHVFFHNTKWSYYQEQINNKTIQVSQKLSERHEVIREVYNAIIIPVLIQFPVLAVMIWLLVSYGFRPLVRISDLIQKRTPTYMRPILLGEAPSEIHSLVFALNDLLLRLEQSLEKQRQFTADAAHELRTPLTAVRLQLDLMQRSRTDAERLEAVETLERGVSRSIHLVQQLLELARQEPEYGTDKTAPVNLSSLIRDIAEEQKLLAHDKAIKIELETKGVTVSGDASALSVMIGNLVNNAIAYTEQGGFIKLYTTIDDGRPILEIRDSGIGIGQQDRSRIFDRFYRVAGTGASGSGLGLSIVKTIADKHGIEIIISEGLNGKGTAFRLIFPRP